MSLPRLLTRSRMRVRISPWFPVLLCAFYRLDPVGCFWPFLGAAAIHEAGHCLAVLLCGGSIHSLALTARGAVLQTSPLSYRQEALCALAGPCAGFLLLFWVRLVPWLAFWGLMQGLYNLLPVYPMDGGRALRCALLSRWTPEQADSVSRWVTWGWAELWPFWPSTPPVGFIWDFGRHWQPGCSCGGCSIVSKGSLDKILAKILNCGYNKCNSKNEELP